MFKTGIEARSEVATHRQLGQIDIEGKFVANEVELLVLRSRLHQVGTASDVLALALRDKLQRQCVSRRSNTVCGRVVSAVDNAVRGTALIVRADRGVPGVSSVA